MAAKKSTKKTTAKPAVKSAAKPVVKKTAKPVAKKTVAKKSAAKPKRCCCICGCK